jgi:nitroreductase
VDALDAIFARRSIGRLEPPGPGPGELQTILRAAAAAPDHNVLRPLRLIVLEGSAKDAFGAVLADAYTARCAAAGVPVVPAKAQKERTKLGRAPLVIVVAATDTTDGNIPFAEQEWTAAAAAQNAMLAATALGFGSMWRTGDPAFDPAVKRALGLEEDDTISGFLYIGTVTPERQTEPNEPDLDGIVTVWSPPALRYDMRPLDHAEVHTADLPATPLRDRSIPASAWVEAPDSLVHLGDDIGQSSDITFKRRIGPWLLWRAGPATGGDARYLAVAADDLAHSFTFRLFPDGTGRGVGPSGATHTRFRTWKEDLRDAATAR